MLTQSQMIQKLIKRLNMVAPLIYLYIENSELLASSNRCPLYNKDKTTMWPILLHTSSLIKYKRVIIGLILFSLSGFYKQFAFIANVTPCTIL